MHGRRALRQTAVDRRRQRHIRARDVDTDVSLALQRVRRHRKTFSSEPISGARADRLEGWRDLDADSPVREHYNIYPESDDEAAPAVDAGDGSASEGESASSSARRKRAFRLPPLRPARAEGVERVSDGRAR